MGVRNVCLDRRAVCAPGALRLAEMNGARISDPLSLSDILQLIGKRKFGGKALASFTSLLIGPLLVKTVIGHRIITVIGHRIIGLAETCMHVFGKT